MGTIRSASPRSLTTSVHPHGRGDNVCAAGTLCRRNGSPPRAWGQSPHAVRAAPLLRFTPTGVGTISSRLAYESMWAVHPHGRGDNKFCAGHIRLRFGSPPRAWGQLVAPRGAGSLRRFTPTGVGTIRIPRHNASATPVHPHGRGDNRLLNRVRIGICGSPPRAWGQSPLRHNNLPPHRFTPTGVGTIAVPPALRECGTVHPHGRGDNSAAGV